jgi:hypothetical protein
MEQQPVAPDWAWLPSPSLCHSLPPCFAPLNKPRPVRRWFFLQQRCTHEGKIRRQHSLLHTLQMESRSHLGSLNVQLHTVSLEFDLSLLLLV